MTSRPRRSERPPQSRDARAGSEAGAGTPSPAADGPIQEAPEAAGRPSIPAALFFDDPLSLQSTDDTDRGWGEDATGTAGSDDLARFLNEKPPHHI